MAAEKIPYGNIKDVAALGALIHEQRKQMGLTQAELGSIQNIGTRFVSEIEHGKTTAEIGKVLDLLHGLGLEVHILPRNWSSLANE